MNLKHSADDCAPHVKGNEEAGTLHKIEEKVPYCYSIIELFFFYYLYFLKFLLLKL